MKIKILIVLVIACALFSACSNDKSKTTNDDKDIEVTLENDMVTLNQKTEEDVVFYNLFSPVDLVKMLDVNSSYYNSAYINSLNNITKYASSQKVALNIGLYGADLAYLWMFEQTQQAMSYLSAIQHLTSKLGIPNTFVESTFKVAESSANQEDSLITIIRDAYSQTNRFLNESNRDNAAVLVLLGGWIETLYISLNMYTKPNSQFASKIITQKYSLMSLITMVQNTQDDIVMSEYLLLLKRMQDAFNEIEIELHPDDVEIDTINKSITIKGTDNMLLEPDKFKTLKILTKKIRTHIIS